MLDHSSRYDWQLQLISLFCWADDGFTLRGWGALCARFSPNATPRCADSEILAAYLFARARGHHSIKAAWRFARDFLAEFFPRLPAYSAFVDRLHRLTPALLRALESASEVAARGPGAEALVDSCPIVVAHARRARRARVAPELASRGYCASKGSWFYGLKLHVVARRRPGRLPVPLALGLSPASVHDLRALEPLAPEFGAGRLYADKAYQSASFEAELEASGCALETPRKRVQGRFHFAGPDTPSLGVSRARQPIESLFAWLEAKTGIQRASRARSTKGLLLFVWSSLVVATLLMGAV